MVSGILLVVWRCRLHELRRQVLSSPLQLECDGHVSGKQKYKDDANFRRIFFYCDRACVFFAWALPPTPCKSSSLRKQSASARVPEILPPSAPGTAPCHHRSREVQKPWSKPFACVVPTGLYTVSSRYVLINGDKLMRVRARSIASWYGKRKQWQEYRMAKSFDIILGLRIHKQTMELPSWMPVNLEKRPLDIIIRITTGSMFWRGPNY